MSQVQAKRASGRYENRNTVGETVRTFIPASLPPEPQLNLERLQGLLESAAEALGRMDGVGWLLPDRSLFLYLYIRKEAVLSSQIEGTQSSLSDLLLFEEKEAPGVPFEDVVQVSNYVAAMDHGLARLKEGFPVSLRLIREIHRELMKRGRGSEKQPGEFRGSQNWIGGSHPGNAVFVPPPPELVMECMGGLERFLHADTPGMPRLVKIALAHAQFETIHPFLDGNGRVGRLLITLLLCAWGVLSEPLLYLSLYFKTHRNVYYDLLNRVRSESAWEDWAEFFLEGVRETAVEGCRTARAILDRVGQDRQEIEGLGRSAGTALRLHNWLCHRPMTSIRAAARGLRVSEVAVGRAMTRLERLGIARERTGRQRGRLFAYEKYLALIQ